MVGLQVFRLSWGAVIALRRTIERGLRHPVLGPFCVLLLALLLAFTFLHSLEDGHDAGAGAPLGYLCIALAALLLVRGAPRPSVVSTPRVPSGLTGRAPPSAIAGPRPRAVLGVFESPPLRR